MILQYDKNLSHILQQETWRASCTFGCTLHEVYGSTRREAYKLLLSSLPLKVLDGEKK